MKKKRLIWVSFYIRKVGVDFLGTLVKKKKKKEEDYYDSGTMVETVYIEKFR